MYYEFEYGWGLSHNGLDAPPERRFHGRELKVCWTLTGSSPRVEQLAPDVFRLCGGAYAMNLQIAADEGLPGEPVRIETRSEPGTATVTAYLHRGAEREWVFDNTFRFRLGFALELAKADAPFAPVPFRFEPATPDVCRVVRGGAALRFPAHAVHYYRGDEAIPLDAW